MKKRIAIIAAVLALLITSGCAEDLTSELDAANTQIESLSKQIQDMQTTISDLEKENSELLILADELDQLKQNKRNDSNHEIADFSDEIVSVDINGCHVRYIRSEVVESEDEGICLVVYYEFKNNSDENKCFIYTVEESWFQNGIELQPTIYHLNEESVNSELKIQPGIKIIVASSYVLRDFSDVEIYVSDASPENEDIFDMMMITMETSS